MKVIWKIVKYILILAVVLMITDIVLVMGIAHWDRPVQHADAAIILGAAINTPALNNRTLEGLSLYEAGSVDQLVLSGGKIADSDISEAQYMLKVIKKNAKVVPPYILEDQSHNTYDNIKNSKAKLGDKDSVVIVSDEFHLARGVVMAYREGFNHVSWSAPEPTYYSAKELRYYYFREFVAMISYIPKFIKG